MAPDHDPRPLESKSLLAHDDESDDGPARRPPALRLVLSCAVTFGFGFFIALLVLGVRHPAGPAAAFSIAATPAPPPVASRIHAAAGHNDTWFSGPCGRSAATARAANCTLDLLAFSWLPERCRTAADRRDEAAFLAARAWRYAAADQRALADVGRVLADALRHRQATGRDDLRFVVTSGEWHRVHCAFMLRRVQRKLVRGEPVDAYMVSDHHGQHCRQVLLEAQDMWEWERKGAVVQTRVWVKYPECY